MENIKYIEKAIEIAKNGNNYYLVEKFEKARLKMINEYNQLKLFDTIEKV